MENQRFPQPPSHKTFTFGSVILDSNFDSGNCSHAEKVSQTNVPIYFIKYNIWIGTDHPKNNYRTWFYFSIEGLNKGTLVTFNIKNMQNQVLMIFNEVKTSLRRIGSCISRGKLIRLEENSGKS